MISNLVLVLVFSCTELACSIQLNPTCELSIELGLKQTVIKIKCRDRVSFPVLKYTARVGQNVDKSVSLK